MIQPSLFGPHSAHISPTVAPMLPAEERRRLSAQCLKILDKLKQGPATNLQLAVIGYRYGARIHELRKAGYEIVITAKNVESGETTYELRGGE